MNLTINEKFFVIGIISFVIGMGVGAGIRFFIQVSFKFIERIFR